MNLPVFLMKGRSFRLICELRNEIECWNDNRVNTRGRYFKNPLWGGEGQFKRFLSNKDVPAGTQRCNLHNKSAFRLPPSPPPHPAGTQEGWLEGEILDFKNSKVEYSECSNGKENKEWEMSISWLSVVQLNIFWLPMLCSMKNNYLTNYKYSLSTYYVLDTLLATKYSK